MEHTIEIKKIISGGNGLGHLEDGMVVMIPFVLPGEQVKIAETKRFKGHITATTLEIEQPSPERCLPFCPHFGTCGGCAFQHTTYPNQLKIKQAILTETLSRGHVLKEIEIPAPVPSPQTEGYRYTIRLHIAKNGAIGFHQTGSNALVEIEQCPLATPALNKTLQQLGQTGLLPEIAKSCKQLELTCSPADNTVVATLYQSSKKRPNRKITDTLLQELQLAQIAIRFKRQVTFFPDPAPLRQHFSTGQHEYSLQWDSRCFFQINPEQNEQLTNLVCKMAGDVSGKKVLDLFCGMGNFSLPLALNGAAITGVEINPNSIAAAIKNAQNANIRESRFITADVDKFLQKSAKKDIHFDMIMLDPPRQGLGQATRFLPELGADTILYVSCDPATLTRDLKVLTEAGYGLTSVTPVDMFPHTHNIECLAVLEKN
jgi:23S rRNA (uracil1939-C5)-methyltransferase